MRMKKIVVLVLLVLVVILSIPLARRILSIGKFTITGVKMASGISENIRPVKPTDAFPRGTSKVYCWFSWRDAEVNMHIVAKWRYITEKLNIISHTFTLPRQEGSGSVLLTMPEGKTLPSGSYQVDLSLNERILKSHKFKIE